MDVEFGKNLHFESFCRDEACSGTAWSVVTVEIAHMGLAEWSTDGLLLETGEGLPQWCGRHGSGANGMRAVPAPADWKLKTRYTTLICASRG
jgi:hypothetical protein